jgi:hypothetical protein
MSGQRPPPTDGLVPRRVCPARPVLGTCVRLGSRWARLPHASLAGICALCVRFLCKSCFIRDIDLCGPTACFPGAYALRALSWAHLRVWGATGRGYHTPASQGIAHFAHSSYVNRALFGISTSADRWPPCWRCMPCARYVGPLGASWGPPTAAVTRPDDRGVRVWHVQNAKSRFMLPMHSMGGTWSHGAWFSHGKECLRSIWRVRVHGVGAYPVDAGAQRLRARFACASRAANDEVRCARL